MLESYISSEHLNEPGKPPVEWRKHLKPALITVGVVLFISIFLPAPYSIRYWLKRMFYQEKFICRDDTYSFAATSQGACSGHGGIRKRIKE